MDEILLKIITLKIKVFKKYSERLKNIHLYFKILKFTSDYLKIFYRATIQYVVLFSKLKKS